MNTAIDYTSRILRQDYIEIKASEVVKNRFDDLVVFISDNGDLNEYDKLFKSMMNKDKDACENAYKFVFDQAIKMVNKELESKT